MVDNSLMYFRICMADKVIGIKPQFSYIREFCKDYITEEPEDFWISTDLSDRGEPYDKGKSI